VPKLRHPPDKIKRMIAHAKNVQAAWAAYDTTMVVADGDRRAADAAYQAVIKDFYDKGDLHGYDSQHGDVGKPLDLDAGDAASSEGGSKED
jgi:hypothetical protein